MLQAKGDQCHLSLLQVKILSKFTGALTVKLKPILAIQGYIKVSPVQVNNSKKKAIRSPPFHAVIIAIHCPDDTYNYGFYPLSPCHTLIIVCIGKGTLGNTRTIHSLKQSNKKTQNYIFNQLGSWYERSIFQVLFLMNKKMIKE